MDAAYQSSYDNVNAVVIDLGSETIRAGYCSNGLGKPQMEISSIAGVKKSTTDGSNQYFLDDAIKTPIEGMKLNPIIFDGLIQDWDLFEEVINGIIKRLNCIPDETFFMFSEALHTPEKSRQKLLEIIASRFMSSGMVIDSGASHTSVIPVVDFFALKKSYWKADIGGHFLVDQAQEYFSQMNEPITPKYMIKSAKVVSPLGPLDCEMKTDLPPFSSTYHVWAVHETLKDFVQSTLQISTIPLREKPNHKIAKTYVFPDGRTHIFQDEIYSLTEGMFDRNFDLLLQTTNESCPEPTITEMAEHVLQYNDVSIQDDLQQNILVTGGTSAIPGFAERIQSCLSTKFYGIKVRNVSKNPRFDAWLGGANIARMPNFDSHWYSNQQYIEGNRSIHEL
uniref:Actin-related protein 4 n=1 Tax=Panagrolaimus sp. PS1159 TaxID=55785 RepID=A0AC35FZD3_9BILA